LRAPREEQSVEGNGLLFVEAGEAARRLFERRGFQLEHRRDFEIDGVSATTIA
jgi:hypothetical protein